MVAEPLGRPLALILERDQNVRELQKHFLERAGFAVEFVDDGQAALDRATRDRPAVLVTEILVPGIDGLTLCRRLREHTATHDLPIVVFSILSAGARARDAGANAYLRKPLVESVFVATIRDAIAGQSTGGIRERQWATR